MFEQFQKLSEESQRMSKDGFDAAVRSWVEVNKGFQALVAKLTDYSKKSFEEAIQALDQLISAKSVEQAIEIQSQYVKKAHDTYIAEMSKLGAVYVGAARNASKLVEQAAPRKVA